jgi:predicted molibdopterin-dependent oxidoreductase YjgC
MGDDPAKGDPATAALLRKLDFLVVQDVLLTETARLANVVLPAAGLFEKTGTVTNLERRLRLLMKVEECAGASMPDWKIIRTLAKRMGSDMKYRSAVEIMMEIKSIIPMYRDLAVDACWSPEQQPADVARFISSPPVQPHCGIVSTPKSCNACSVPPPSVQKK